MIYFKNTFLVILLSISLNANAEVTSHTLKPSFNGVTFISRLEVVAFVKRLKNHKGKILSVKRINNSKTRFAVKYLNPDGEYDLLKIN